MTRQTPHGTKPHLVFTEEHYHVLKRAHFMIGQVVNSRMSPLTTAAYLRLVSQDMQRLLDAVQ